MKFLDNRLKLFGFVFISSILAVIVTMYLKGILYSAILSALIVLILWVTKGLWLPDNYGKILIRRISLAIVAGVATAPFYWGVLFESLFGKILKEFSASYPFLAGIEVHTSANTIEIFLFVTSCILIINYFNRDTSAMGVHAQPIELEFPEKNYKERLLAFSRILKNNLDSLNRETNWSEEYFTPLDAEVEVKNKNFKKRKVTNLLNAIKRDRRTKVFLVLGDPGSGKSVALRKLCSEMLNEVGLTGKIPIYVNLREWEIKGKWSVRTPPTVEDLYFFILNNLKSKGDLYSSDFVDKYFSKMLEYGRVFFLLDSFDEIPSVLDVDESSWLIDALSTVIFNFLNGAQDSRGLLASRIFRKPTHNFAATTLLEIRPFTESKILQRFMSAIDYDSKLKHLLFSERQEYIPLARNPFTAALILNYAKKNDYTLPNAQIELYDSYILERLLEAKKLRIHNTYEDVTDELVMHFAIEIAYFMFSETEYGLEVPKNDLVRHFKNTPIEQVLDLLCFARIGRMGGGNDKLFSFVHRRFNEFFIAKKFISDTSLVPKDSIPNDSRWRDSLALYCGIASEEEAVAIANFCWRQIKEVKDKNLTLSDNGYLKAIHCLRFLNDAYRSRPGIINNFRDELTDFIFRQINRRNLLETKLAIESVGLIESEKSDLAVCNALDLRNQWISETALRSCRHLPKISDDLEKRIILFLLRHEPFYLVKRKNELLFSFSLSDAFKKVEGFLKILLLDYYLILVGFCIVSCLSPILGLTIVLLYIIFDQLTDLSKNSTFLKKRMMQQREKGNGDKTYAFLLNFEGVARKLAPTRTLVPFRFYVSAIIVFAFTKKDSVSIPLTWINIQDISNSLEVAISTVLLLSMILIFPWLDFFMAIKLSRNMTLRKVLKYALAVTMVFIVVFTLMFFLEKYLAKYVEIASIGVAILFFGLIVVNIVVECIQSFNDSRYLRKLQLFDPLSRRIIERHLNSLRTSYGRKKFIAMIQAHNIKKITGNWSNFQLPNYNDEASTQLAKLEERWLGFER